jgi:hypothetical protein
MDISLIKTYLSDSGRRLAKSRKFQHSGIEEHGENLFVSTEDASYAHAVQLWLAEETDYNGEKFGDGNAVKYGHFSKHAPVSRCSRSLSDRFHSTMRVAELEPLRDREGIHPLMPLLPARFAHLSLGYLEARQHIHRCPVLAARQHSGREALLGLA